MKRCDIHTIATWMSPEYVVPCAREHGIQVAKDLYKIEEIVDNNEWLSVLGADKAYKEIRSLIRNYLTFVKKRDNLKVSDLSLALSLRAMGYVGNFQQVLPIQQSEWRKTAISLWPQGASIPGLLELPLPENTSQQNVQHAILKTVSTAMIRLPHLNRTLLKDRIWQRTSGEIMLTVEVSRNEIETIVLDPSHLSKLQLKKKMFRALRRMREVSDHEYKDISAQLLRAWYRTGFIASPASAMISFAKDIEVGWSALCNNGVPVSISVGHKPGVLTLAITPDHRVWDGSHSGDFNKFIKENFHLYLKGEW